MKKIILLILIFISIPTNSQSVGAGSNTAANYESLLGASVTSRNSLGGVGTYINYTPTEIVGNRYVFEDWKTIATIKIDNKNYKLSNVNLNIKTNNFESKVGKDSMFIFDTSNVEHLYINNSKFKSFYFEKNNKNTNFEVIYDGDNFKLLKGYELGIKYGKPDPTMVRKTVDTYFTDKIYYIKDSNSIKEIKLKKKSILSLFKDKSSKVNEFAKKEKLSFKKDRDLNRIFKYYESL